MFEIKPWENKILEVKIFGLTRKILTTIEFLANFGGVCGSAELTGKGAPHLVAPRPASGGRASPGSDGGRQCPREVPGSWEGGVRVHGGSQMSVDRAMPIISRRGHAQA